MRLRQPVVSFTRTPQVPARAMNSEAETSDGGVRLVVRNRNGLPPFGSPR
jgi:hypothetical protein